MIQKLIYIAVALSMSLLSLEKTKAQDPGETIEIVEAYLYGRLDEFPDSDYNKLLNIILPTETQFLRRQRYPLIRAIRNFADGKRHCIFPASKTSVFWAANIPHDAVVESAPIDRVSAHLISAPNKPLISSYTQIEGGTIAAQMGMAFRDFVGDDISFKTVHPPNDLSSLRMVLAGRVNAMFGWYPDVFEIAERHELPLPKFDPDLVLYESTVHVVCKKFGGVEDLMQTLNTQLSTLRQSGKLKEILSPYARVIE